MYYKVVIHNVHSKHYSQNLQKLRLQSKKENPPTVGSCDNDVIVVNSVQKKQVEKSPQVTNITSVLQEYLCRFLPIATISYRSYQNTIPELNFSCVKVT